jgi:hypothetical protein
MSPGPVADHERSAELVAEIVRLDHATPGLARTVVAALIAELGPVVITTKPDSPQQPGPVPFDPLILIG